MLPCPVEPHVILAAETMNHVGSSKIDWKRTASSPAQRRWLSAARRGNLAFYRLGSPSPDAGVRKGQGREIEAAHPLGAPPLDLR